MPIYEYKCGACGHQFECTQHMADAPISKCPQCQAEQVRKIFSTGGVIGSSKSSGQDFTPPSFGGGCGGGGCGMGGGMCGMG